jgi:peptide/nickel transport system permease protein
MTADKSLETLLPGAAPQTAKRFGWMNWKLAVGGSMVLFIVLVGLIGSLVWDTNLARASSSPLNLPPGWETGGTWDHPLGTENLGRDMLALVIQGAPASLRVGVIAAGIGLLIAVILGFLAGYRGGWIDDVVRVLADAAVTIPALAVMIVLAAAVKNVTFTAEAVLLALFSWPAPTRLIRSQVLSMRERGYVKMARLSGMSSLSIMFREVLPNMIPYLVASFVGAISTAILAATSLEALGLGPTRIQSLGLTLYNSIQGSALLRGMWWWWGFPVIVLMIIFSGLFLLSIGLDEIANPRLQRFARRPGRRAARAAGRERGAAVDIVTPAGVQPLTDPVGAMPEVPATVPDSAVIDR